MKCNNCKTTITKEMDYCPECGRELISFSKLVKKEKNETLTEKPSVGTWTVIGIIFLCVLFLPLGIIAGIITWYSHNQKVKDWRNQEVIQAINKG